MKVTAPVLLLLLAACVVSGALLPRAVWQLASTIQCSQPGVNPMKYMQYGCWCGIGGSGPLMDEVDMCCKVHDKCYERSRKAAGCTALVDQPYILVYDFTCSNKQVTCDATNDKCQAAVCECDRAAAHCFAQNTYHQNYKDLDRKVHCSA